MKLPIIACIVSLTLFSCSSSTPTEKHTDHSHDEHEHEHDHDGHEHEDHSHSTDPFIAPGFVKKWETDTILKTPESVLFHDGILYISNINGKNPLEKDGNGFISKLNTDGSVNELEWAKGLNAPKGMAIANGKLYVTDIDKLVAIDLSTGSISNTYPVENSTFLNDVTALGNTIYFSDMKMGKIHELTDDKVSTFAEGLESVNGLFAESDQLLALTGEAFQAINYDTKEVSTVSEGVTGGDGLEKTIDGNYVASRWKGQVYSVIDGEATLLLDTEKQESQTADIGYIPEENLVVIPTFFKNKIVAYKLGK